MEKIEDTPEGGWPQFMYDGETVVGQVGTSGPWYEIPVGKQIRFNRHGTFKVVKHLLTRAHLEVTLPRKGWNPKPSTHLIRLPLRKVVTVSRRVYGVRKLNPYDEARFGRGPKGGKRTFAR